MKYRFAFSLLFASACIAIAGLPNEARAQDYTYAAGEQWGTTPGGVAVNGALESAEAHELNGEIAGQVNAAKLGALVGLPGTSLAITSVGSQTIVTNTISGDNISSSINATQTSSNSGSVSNTGTITHN